MAEDPRPKLSGKWLRIVIAAAALAIIAVVAYIGSVLLFGSNMSTISFPWSNSGGGPNGGVEAVPTEPVAAPTPEPAPPPPAAAAAPQQAEFDGVQPEVAPSAAVNEEDLLDIPAFLRRQAN